MTKRNAQTGPTDQSASQKPELSVEAWAKSGAKSPDDFPSADCASAQVQKPIVTERKHHAPSRSSSNGGKHVERR